MNMNNKYPSYMRDYVMSEDDRENVFIIKKSWWNLVFESLEKAIASLVIFLLFAMLSNGKSGPNWELSWMMYFITFTIWMVGTVISIITTEIRLDVKKKEAFFKDYFMQKPFKEIVSINFNRVCSKITLIGKFSSISISFVKNTDQAGEILHKFYNS